MLENRSTDQVLGWLYDAANPPLVNIPEQSPPTYDGLSTDFYNLDSKGNKQYVVKGTNNNMNVPIHDPHEEFSHVTSQVFGSNGSILTPLTPEPATMGGFYQDFETFNYFPEQIMQSYTPEELPVLNGLAKNFAVSDQYFCSVPTQTNCNRAFAACGNSLGMNAGTNQLEAWVNNRGTNYSWPGISEPKGPQFNQKTLWNVLSENGLGTTSDWMQYYSDGTLFEDILGLDGYSYTRDLMNQLQDPKFDAHFDSMDAFLANAKAGTLPKFSFLEPSWGLEVPFLLWDIGFPGTDYHPPTNLAPGEKFVQSIYEALTSNKDAWAETLFIINFDEHGGTYDHVPTPWGAKAPWANPADGTPSPAASEGNFNFDRFGVRVPLILVSPQIKQSTVFRAEGDTPYDHTSVIATILKLLEIPQEKWELGSRTANAPTFENVLSSDPPRTDIPVIEANSAGDESSLDRTTIPPNDIQLRMVRSLIAQAIEKKGLNEETVNNLALGSMENQKTLSELTRLFIEIMGKIKVL
jgi:phospholipase C